MEGLPDPKLLEGMKEVEDTEPVKTVEASQTTDPELVGSSKRLPNNRPTVTKSHFLPAPGLPGTEDLGFGVCGNGRILA